MIQHLNKLADDEEASQLLDIQDEDIAGGNEEDQPREEEDQIREGSDERQLTPSIDPWVAQQIPDTINWVQATTDTFNNLFPAAFEAAYRALWPLGNQLFSAGQIINVYNWHNTIQFISQ